MYTKMGNPIFYSDCIFYVILLIRPLCLLYHMGISLLSDSSISFITPPSSFTFCSKKETKAENKILSSVPCLFTFSIIFSSDCCSFALFPYQHFVKLRCIFVPWRHNRETNRETCQIPRYKFCGLRLLRCIRNDFLEALLVVIHKGPEKIQLISIHHNIRP